jgi:CheY-like chemotaxis protein
LQKTPVVILSLKDLDKEQNQHSMADGYLPKPFTADDLSKTVNQFLQASQLQ